MTDEVAGTKVSQFPLLTSFTGDEQVMLVKGSLNYRALAPDYAAWSLGYLGVNRPPTSHDITTTTFDTRTAPLTGNLIIDGGAVDPDTADTARLASVTYGGASVSIDEAFAATYGVFFVSDDGDYSFTLGPAARALTTGDVRNEVFAYTVADGKGGIATSHFVVNITGTNSAPIVSSVNGSTPMNVPLTGNLLYRQAFDPESAVSIGSFTIKGIVGTKPTGTDVAIPGIGTVRIASTGDLLFTPSSGFLGPVPTITYVVTDGVNNVNGYLTMAVNPLIATGQPIILYTDTPSGPVDDGGQADGGAFLHVHGLGLGANTDAGTATKVYIGGVEVGEYVHMDDDPFADPALGVQRIAVRVGALAGLPLGEPQHVKVVASGQESNTNCTFTPNPGRIFYVSKSGNDSTGVIGDPTHPYRLLQTPDRLGGVYPLMRAGDQVIVRGDGGAEWTDIGFSTAWMRFRDVAQQGSDPIGVAGTGWIWLMGYPGEVVQYRTTAGNKGGIQGPGQDVTGTTGDYFGMSNIRIRVDGGATRDAGPLNMQYNAQRCRAVACEFGPWVAGDSPTLNCAGVSGQGNFFEILGCHIHDIEGTSELQNHGIYPGTNSYGWTIAWCNIHDISGGSCISFNDSDGGTGTFETPFGVWTGFTNIRIHHNRLMGAAKYAISFNDVGADQGELDAQVFNNVIGKTGLPPLHFGTTTSTSDVTFAFNTFYDFNVQVSGGNALFRNDGLQQSPSHKIRLYNNIFAFGPDTVHGTGWLNDTTGFSNGIEFKRNLYFVNGDTSAPAPSTVDSMAVVGDPKFVNAAAGDFNLQASSPAINAATQALPAGMLVGDDYTGQRSRQLGGGPEIGANEYPTTTPYLITAPTTSGTPQIGVLSSVGPAVWGNMPSSVTGQWRLDGSPVGSPVNAAGTVTYTPVAGDERKVLTLSYTVTNGSGSIPYTVTLGTVAVGAGAPVNTGLPVITGVAQVGQLLTVGGDTWTGLPGSPTFIIEWLRNGAVISGATATTYTPVSGDQGALISARVYAVDPVNGTPFATAVAVGPIAAAPADPVIAQAAVSHALVANTNVNFVFGSDVGNGSVVLAFIGEWDQAPYNGHYSDTQGHTSSDVVGTTSVFHTAGNPWAAFRWFKSNATGSYTLTINMDSGAGGGAVAVEISDLDPTSEQDIPADTAQGTGTAISLTATTSTTKANDLVLVGITVSGTGHTITPDAGWDLVDHVDGANQGVFLFKRKETAIETFAFTGTLDTSANWLGQSWVGKGS